MLCAYLFMNIVVVIVSNVACIYLYCGYAVGTQDNLLAHIKIAMCIRPGIITTVTDSNSWCATNLNKPWQGGESLLKSSDAHSATTICRGWLLSFEMFWYDSHVLPLKLCAEQSITSAFVKWEHCSSGLQAARLWKTMRTTCYSTDDCHESERVCFAAPLAMALS